MKRFSSLLSKRSSMDTPPAPWTAGPLTERRVESDAGVPEPDANTPEGTISRAVKLFCESGGPNNAAGEEVLHLPGIVESAESSPAAAKEAAYVIRKFLSKDNYSRGYVQYNAVMLVRILSDHPGPSFTKHLEGKFVATTKDLLRDGRDVSVQQILRETLDTLEAKEMQDETLKPLITMWRGEKSKYARLNGSNQSIPPRDVTSPPPPNASLPPSHQPGHFSRNRSRPKTLPPPHELASRIEEAKTSSKLLLQVVQTTPPAELFANDLVREFADRCQSASRSVQAYIAADHPPPDNDTLQTLIETNDQLAHALSQHQRALLQARRLAGNSPGNGVASPFAPPPPAQQQPPPRRPDARGRNNGLAPINTRDLGSVQPPPGPPPSHRLNPIPPQPALENPFADPTTTTTTTTTHPAPPPPLQIPQRQYPNGIAATSGPLAPAFSRADSDASLEEGVAPLLQQQRQQQQQQGLGGRAQPVQNGVQGGGGYGGVNGLGSERRGLGGPGARRRAVEEEEEDDDESDVEMPGAGRDVQYRF